jgi:hypothetical protein
VKARTARRGPEGGPHYHRCRTARPLAEFGASLPARRRRHRSWSATPVHEPRMRVQVVTGSMDATVKMWDLAAGKCVTTLCAAAIGSVSRFRPSAAHAGRWRRKAVEAALCFEELSGATASVVTVPTEPGLHIQRGWVCSGRTIRSPCARWSPIRKSKSPPTAVLAPAAESHFAGVLRAVRC